MSDLLYTVVINDEVFECVDYSRPVWMKPSMKGLRFIPNNRDEVQDALIIFGVDHLDFSQDLKSKIIKMKADCISENGPDCLLDPYATHKLLMLDAKKELKNLTLKARFLVVNHVGLPEDIDLGCKVQACLAECNC
jgi:hypothetical protein